ncbi:MAG TPA: hypothetical protein VJK03_04750 [Candidatus Nanoarchaeia archaeon]|nr:hypothetical protein [Candidatus Nanoarchaeia archaeon]
MPLSLDECVAKQKQWYSAAIVELVDKEYAKPVACIVRFEEFLNTLIESAFDGSLESRMEAFSQNATVKSPAMSEEKGKKGRRPYKRRSEISFEDYLALRKRGYSHQESRGAYPGVNARVLAGYNLAYLKYHSGKKRRK